MDNIIRVFHVLYTASGLKININKSNLYRVGVSLVKVVCMVGSSVCKVESLPLTYLGLPIGSNMNRVASWKVLADRFKAKLSGWKASLLSIGGCLTLIKCVLGSLMIYYMSIFKSLEMVIKELERLRKKHAWVKWSNVLASFNKGGLGVGSLKGFNVFLLYKWRWRLLHNPNT
ncbi:hypothetical protein Tco_0986849 [Tanacetum coccineum]